ncbi:MAG: hypothetical protein O3C40_27360 [Planctomycetota bacterium]|nr:hypothetical protein [Planctomycetota bacterium]
MSARKTPNPNKKSKSFTAYVSPETWKKIEEYKKYGNWNTNQMMNQALKSFFEIIESEDKKPEVPLICQTLRDMAKRTRARFK